MAHDLLFGRTKQNWSREASAALPVSDEVTFKMTDAEMRAISTIALVRAAAEGGDVSARKKLALWVRSLAKVQARANRGEASARRKMLVLRESGVLRPTQKIDLMGMSRRERKRLKRQRHLQNLRARAAAGDQAAVARLQQMATDLGVPASTVLPTTAATTTPQTPGSQTLQSLYPGIYSSQAAPAAAPTYPTAYPTYPQAQYAYQSPYYNPSLAQNPYGPPAQPTVDVYQGEEEAALAGDGGGAERAALARMRGTHSCGAEIPNVSYRAAVYRQAVRHSGGKTPSTRDVFLAKSKVDKVMGRAGIGIYLPGARPGRRTA